MSKRVVVLTGDQLRHNFFRKALAQCNGIEVLTSYCEVKPDIPVTDQSEFARRHLELRTLSEQDFFGIFDRLTPDLTNPIFVKTGAINEQKTVENIINLQPDVLVAYGCSLVKSELLEEFKGRFLNVHLGLSPYYRGTATNFWPLVNNEPECVGATFMYIDAGVDTGEIIHQIRADIHSGDSPHDIGNRLISIIPETYAQIITKLDEIKTQPQPVLNREEKYYKRKDYSDDAVRQMYRNFEKGMIDEYLAQRIQMNTKTPIVKNSVLS